MPLQDYGILDTGAPRAYKITAFWAWASRAPTRLRRFGHGPAARLQDYGILGMGQPRAYRIFALLLQLLRFRESDGFHHGVKIGQ